MAKMSKKSKSFLRATDQAVFSGAVRDFVKLSAPDFRRTGKKVLIEYMTRHEIDDRAVFFAENLKTKTSKELEILKDDLAHRLEEAGADGVAELHIGGDGSSKDAHIHFWGRYAEEVKQAIEDFIADNRLSNKEFFEYTSEDLGSRFFIKKGEVAEKSKETETETVEEIEYFEDRIALENAEKEAKKEEKSWKELLAEAKKAVDEALSIPVPKMAKKVEIESIEDYLSDLDRFFEEAEE